MKRSIMALITALALGACSDPHNIYLYDAKVLETDFANGARLTVDVSLNGSDSKRMTCRLKNSMTPIWVRLSPGDPIKLARTSKWEYGVETFCGLLNQAEAKEVIPQYL